MDTQMIYKANSKFNKKRFDFLLVKLFLLQKTIVFFLKVLCFWHQTGNNTHMRVGLCSNIVTINQTD